MHGIVLSFLVRFKVDKADSSSSLILLSWL